MVNSRDDITLGVDLAPSAAVSADTPGSVLAAARQKMGLSVGDVAAKLRMSVVQIDAIERGEYGKLPKGTFLRGFVRSYAKLVQLQPLDVLSLLEKTNADSRQPTIVVPTQNIRMSAPGEPYGNPRARILLALVLMLAIVSGGAYWWFQVRPAQVGRPGAVPGKVAVETVTAPLTVPSHDALAATPSAQAAPAAENLPKAVAAPSSTPTPPTSVVAVADTSPAPAQQVAPLTQTTAPLAAAPVTSAADVSKPTVPKGSGSLQFVFSGDAWVEVVDANARTLVSRRFQAGQSETVVGKLPVSVVIGNATVTRLRFNDLDFDLTPHTRVAVARFTLK
ncbi:MAG: DUF4115 domain-containing protein [Burkholderiales bacterium]|nr:DUF4115 domain-containing protein [Burkholderiales bacterium]